MTSVWTHLRAPFGGVRRQAFTPTSETARLQQLPLEGTSQQRISDMKDLDVRDISEAGLSEDYLDEVRAACAADPNIMAVWALWVLSADVGSEVMMSVRLERPSAESVQGLIRRVDALGGPSCAVALAHGKPRKAAFYRRGE